MPVVRYSLIAPALVASAALAATSAVAAPAVGAVGCLITPIRSADVGTPVAGVVEAVRVERGDAVAAGQVLFTLRAEVERASSVSAEVRARNEAAVRGAAANLEAARLKYERTRSLRSDNFVSTSALDQAKAEFDVAEQQLRHHQNQLDSARADIAPARAQLAQRTVRAPFAGLVVDRLAQPGERVELQPLLRIADMSRLRVEVIVPASQFGRVALGQRLAVQPEVPGLAARPGTVTQVDRFIDAASNTFRVRLELDNPTLEVPAGARCKVALDGAAPPTAAGPAAAAPPPAASPRAGLRLDDSLGAAPSSRRP